MRWTLLSTAVDPWGCAVCSPRAAQPPPAPPQVWTWDQVKDHFHLNNTTLMASLLNIDELKAQEITAHLRPNPDFTLSADGTQIAPSHGVWQPFAGTFVSPGVSYLFERRNKRGLRYQAAKEGTAIGVAQTVRLGTQSALQSAQRLRRRPPGQSRAAPGAGQSRLLRQGAENQPRPLPGRRHRPDRSRPPRTAAPAI